MTCLGYLSSRPAARRLYLTAMTASLVAGAVTAPALAWTLADLAIGIMTVFNLAVLLLMSREVAEETAILLDRDKARRRGKDRNTG